MLIKLIHLIFGVLLSRYFVVNGQKCSTNRLSNSDLIKTYSDGNLDFSLELYKSVANGEDNVFISPFSIGVALAMTSAGARWNTLNQMTSTLRLGKFFDEDNVHRAIHSVLNSFCSTPDFTLTTANKIYVQKGFAIKSSFRNTLTQSYNSSVETANFKTNANKVSKRINKWVENQTESHIKDLFPPNSLDPSTILVLVNAIYFHGNWLHTFSEEYTKPEYFKASNERKILIPMMEIDEELIYAESNDLNCQIIELPYRGNRLVMYVILPKDVNGVQQLRERLTAESFRSLKNRMKLSQANVKLPKFKLNYRNELNDILVKMGMNDLFDGVNANLSGIAKSKNGNLYVSLVIHQAYVLVDEKAPQPQGPLGWA